MLLRCIVSLTEASCVCGLTAWPPTPLLPKPSNTRNTTPPAGMCGACLSAAGTCRWARAARWGVMGVGRRGGPVAPEGCTLAAAASHGYMRVKVLQVQGSSICHATPGYPGPASMAPRCWPARMLRAHMLSHLRGRTPCCQLSNQCLSNSLWSAEADEPRLRAGRLER